MDKRQETLLLHLIESYIKTAEPVGSKFLVRVAGLDWSEATVRNELRALEEAGFLTHPHTSAGRIPTLLGYRFYLDELDFASLKLAKAEATKLEQALAEKENWESSCKQLAKAMTTLSEEMVLVAFSPDNVYYTGLSNLFHKPDFEEQRAVADVSSIFDAMEEIVPAFYEQVGDEPKYFLGTEHPFGSMLSVLGTRFGDNDESLIALVGPQRMNYKHNWELINKVLEIL